MSHFYGTLEGNRGEATRCGTKSSGLITEAAGWQGAIRVTVYHTDDRDMFRVELIPWQGSAGKHVTLAAGELDASCENIALVHPGFLQVSQ